MTASAGRLGYLDWLRGLAVLIMIQGHVLDSWTRESDRLSPLFTRAMVIGGFGAPIFLFLAGVGVVLAAEARTRRLGDPRVAARAVAWRGWQILGLAFLFRLQAYILGGGGSLSGLLKVDILNVMGPAMAATAMLWGRLTRDRNRVLAFALMTVAVGVLTPSIRTSEWVGRLPDPLEWYLRPVPGRTNFTLFPWSGFVTLGALVGVLIHRARAGSVESLLMRALAPAGLFTALGSYWASYLPRFFEGASFWTSSPAYFFLRCGVLTATVPFAWLWSNTLTRPGSWRPLEVFGRSSLFVYWIHIEMVYGIISTPLHRALTVERAALAFAVFAGFLFGLVCAKDALKRRWRPVPS